MTELVPMNIEEQKIFEDGLLEFSLRVRVSEFES